MPSQFAGNGWNADSLPDRNGEQDSLTPSRTTEKDDEYLVVLHFDNLGQAMQQVSDDSFAGRMIAHIPGAELIEIAMTFHNTGQATVFLPLNGHLPMTGGLDLGTNDITSVGDISMTGDLSTVANLDVAGDVTSGGQFLADAGTAAAPGYAFTNDLDTGWFNPAAGDMALSSNGSEVFRYDNSTDRFGFGITTPQFALDLLTSSNSTFRVKKTTAGGATFRFEATSGDTGMIFVNASSTKWACGNDSSLSNSFQISRGSVLGTNPAIAIHTSENVTIGDSRAATSQLEVVGSLGHKSTTITGAYTAGDETTIFGDTTSSSFTVTLPAVAGILDRKYYIKNTGTGTLTVDGPIDGNLTIELAEFDSITIQNDGTEWFVL